MAPPLNTPLETSSPAVAEKEPIVRRCLEKHADDGYSRSGNFGGSLVRDTVLVCSPDGTNVCGSRGVA